MSASPDEVKSALVQWLPGVSVTVEAEAESPWTAQPEARTSRV